MRIYSDFKQALNEIRRDVGEMGIQVHPHSWQDKIVKGNPDFNSLELQNYMYTVTQPRSSDLNPVQPWADAEWEERVKGINGLGVNPGTAWQLRQDVWKNFLVKDEHTQEPVFGYTYSDRFDDNDGVSVVIEELKKNPDSRQCFISIWTPEDIGYLGGVSRVPCTLGYQIQVRQGQLNLLYIQRSADLATHFENDVYLAFQLQGYIAFHTGIPLGHYSHLIMSLHLFKKDAQGIF